MPKLQQVVEIPLQFFLRPPDTRRATDDAHALGHGQRVHDFTQFVTILTLDATRNTSATRVVWHQDKMAPGQADEGGEGGALVAAFVLLDLDDEFLAFP